MKQHILWIVADSLGLSGKMYLTGTMGWLTANPILAAVSVVFIVLSVVHILDHALQLIAPKTEPPADPSELVQKIIDETERQRKEELEALLSLNGIRLADAT